MKKILALAIILLFTAGAKADKKKLAINKEKAILVEGPITGSSVRSMRDQIAELEESGDKTIDMVFNSPGGELLSGYLLVDRMDAARAKGITIRCFVRGVAASMAFQMLLHCDERYATPHALLLWHPVRVFWMGPLTATDAELMAKHLGFANETVLNDLRTHMVDLSEEDLMWHYQQESLHQAVSLDLIAPSFFNYIGADIGNIYEVGVDKDKSKAASKEMDQRNIIYIHERFMEK